MVGVDQARQHCGPIHGQKYSGSDAVIEEEPWDDPQQWLPIGRENLLSW